MFRFKDYLREIKMLKETINSRIEKAKELNSKVEGELKKVVDSVKSEGVKFLHDMGASEESKTVKAVLGDLRKNNPDVKTFIKNLNVATYEARFEAQWKSKVVPAFTKMKAENTYYKKVEPKIEEYSTKIKELQTDIKTQANELGQKVQKIKDKLVA